MNDNQEDELIYSKIYNLSRKNRKLMIGIIQSIIIYIYMYIPVVIAYITDDYRNFGWYMLLLMPGCVFVCFCIKNIIEGFKKLFEEIDNE